MTPLELVAAGVGLVGLVCLVMGLVVRRRDIRLGLILNAAFCLLIGGAVELQTWSRTSPNYLGDILAIGMIAMGSGRLCLALTRPDILMTRRERDAQIIKNTALAAATGENL